jgi:ferredoxin
MSKKDGKCTLIEGKNKKGFYTAVVGDDEYIANVNAAKACPVKIIKVEKVK